MSHPIASKRHVLLRRRPSILFWVHRRIALRQQRRDLSTLEPHLLRDIGISASAAQREAKKPAWDVPDHWQNDA